MITNLENWGEIPVLHIFNDNFDKNAPVVFFLHGFESGKEHNLHYAYQLVSKGCRVIMPDAHLHGDRDMKLDQVEISLRFWEIVLTSIEELGKLKQELSTRGYDNGQKIGVAGTSMGGITTLGCLTAYPWIDTAAIMMGTPGYVELAKAQIELIEKRGFKVPLNEEEKRKMFETLSVFDASNQLEKLANKPLFFWHGSKDEVVPFAPTSKFVDDLIVKYGESQIEFMKEKNSGHAVSRKGMLRATEWLANCLA
ncbi:prolyl oligopeptidase family serine peptidase [Psychrobacillus sp. NPDC093200]|uniref:prolyl oligopeptidase family serine peptidase n=1 Tax=Psychrobacillus sp. NPDC093200 TaxID=3390656 RepID=UPI003D053A24